MSNLIQTLDRNGDGVINYDEFLYGLRGGLNETRRAIVHAAFNKLDKDGSGVITVDDIIDVYNAKLHPKVMPN